MNEKERVFLAVKSGLSTIFKNVDEKIFLKGAKYYDATADRNNVGTIMKQKNITILLRPSSIKDSTTVSNRQNGKVYNIPLPDNELTKAYQNIEIYNHFFHAKYNFEDELFRIVKKCCEKGTYEPEDIINELEQMTARLNEIAVKREEEPENKIAL